MTSLFGNRRLLLLAVLTLILPLTVACSGADEEDATATLEAPSSAATLDSSTTSDTKTPDAEGTPDTDISGTPDADMTGTPDSDKTPDAGTAGTPDSDGTPSAVGTPDADATGTPGAGGVVDDPFADLGDLQGNVPNFTLEFAGSFENVPDDTGEIYSADIDMMLMQSEPDIYHLSFVTTGDDAVEIEVWSLADATYIAESGGTPVEVPGGMASQFAPTNLLVIIPPVETLAVAEEVGQEDVNGRPATHYRVEAEEAATILVPEDTEINDAEGDMDVWIDDELGIVVQMKSDVTWTNADDTDAAVTIDYMVSDIDETDDIEAPSS